MLHVELFKHQIKKLIHLYLLIWESAYKLEPGENPLRPILLWHFEFVNKRLFGFVYSVLKVKDAVVE